MIWAFLYFSVKLFNTRIYSFILTNTIILLSLLSISCFVAESIVLYSCAFLFNNSCFSSESIVLYCCAVFFNRSCFLTISFVLYFGTVFFPVFPVYFSYPLLVFFSPRNCFLLWLLHCFKVLFLFMIIHQFYSFVFDNYFTQTCSKLYFVMPWNILFPLYFFNGINKWGCSIHVFSVLNRGYVSFIIKHKRIHIFWYFCGLKVQLMQYEENDMKNPVHSLLFIIWFSRIDLLRSKSVNSPSVSNKLSGCTSVPQTSTVLGKISCVLNLIYDTFFAAVANGG